MQNSISSPHEDPTTESNDNARFDKSLQELKALRSQLHYAADYCEMSFLKAKQKTKVMENTKKYICKAMVTVVDHLGSVSANLDRLINGRVDASPTELRIDCLKHRLLTCQMYTSKLDLAQVCWSVNFPSHHSRYSSPLISPHGRPDGVKRSAQQLNVINEKVPHDSIYDIKYLNARISSGFEPSKALPVCEGPSILWRPRTLSFQSGSHQLVPNEKNKKTSASKKTKRII